jgi:predicted kinase
MPAQARRQTLLLLKGHPATGKSTLAKALARRLAWPLIDKDAIKDHVYHLPDGSSLAYNIMWQIARHQLEIGLSVVVDSPLSYPQAYATGQELAATFNSRLVIVETSLAESIWRERLDQRLQEQQTHRTAGWVAMQQLLAYYADSWRYPIEPDHHLLVDSAQPVDQLVRLVIHQLDQRS